MPTRLRTFIPALVILMLSMFATGVVAWYVNRNLKTAGQQQFQVQAEAIGQTISNVMSTYEQVIRAGTGLYYASPELTHDGWQTFVAAQKLDQEFPGMQGFGYVKVIKPADLARHVADQRANGRPQYDVTPATPREIYTAIVYLEPEDARNLRAIGFDMFSEPVRRLAMERARDTGEPALTPHVRLVQEDGTDEQKGALLYLPVYDRPALSLTLEERRGRLTGFVYGAFRMHDLFQKMLTKHMPDELRDSRLQIYDGSTVEASSLLFDSGGAGKNEVAVKGAPAGLFKHRVKIDVGGVRWMIDAASSPAFEKRLPWSRTWLVFALGGVLSLLVSAIAASLSYARDRSVEAEHVLAAEVEQRRRAQEDVQLANRELIHRVKNTIAIVTSIAAQTARHSASLDEFAVSFRERMGALGRVHDLLKPNPAFSPELGAFVREVLSPYCAGNPDRLSARGPMIEIPRQEAVLLSLLVNELATNATKYGAWSVPNGHVALAWAIETSTAEAPDEQADVIDIVWKESGGPTVSAPSKTGFGTNVMKFAIERGLRGHIAPAYHPEGFVCRIKIPRSVSVAGGERELDPA